MAGASELQLQCAGIWLDHRWHANRYQRMTMMLVHATARLCRSGTGQLSDLETGSLVWTQLRRAFVVALAAILMPDHLHLLLHGPPTMIRRRLRTLISGLRRSKGPAAALRWLPIELPSVVPNNVKHCSRQIRYVALNPCRDGLAADPLAWPLSTYRDVMGGVADPWVTAAQLAKTLGRREAGFRSALHRYVSSDPSVHVGGTALPIAVQATSVASAGLTAIAEAAASATRSRPAGIRSAGATRDLFLRLARHCGWTQTRPLAEACGISSAGVRASLRRTQHDTVGVAAAALCLGDPRTGLWCA